MPTDFQMYQAGRRLLGEIDTLLDVDAAGVSRVLNVNVNDAKVILQTALQEIAKRASEASRG